MASALTALVRPAVAGGFPLVALQQSQGERVEGGLMRFPAHPVFSRFVICHGPEDVLPILLISAFVCGIVHASVLVVKIVWGG
jgi:hypothetical protein